MLKRTYELVTNGPPAMPWEDYERTSLAEWRSLISGASYGDEALMHSFLERNPSFVPGAFSFPTSGHGPMYSGVFSKPPLSAVGMHIPDFLWLATATDIVFPIFVEIETPSKRWFTEGGQPRAEFTQARNQLVIWKQWFGNAVNQLALPGADNQAGKIGQTSTASHAPYSDQGYDQGDHPSRRTCRLPETLRALGIQFPQAAIGLHPSGLVLLKTVEHA